MEGNKCIFCIWRDQCGDQDGCDFFETGLPGFEEMVCAAEYESILNENYEWYLELVEEQDS